MKSTLDADLLTRIDIVEVHYLRLDADVGDAGSYATGPMGQSVRCETTDSIAAFVRAEGSESPVVRLILGWVGPDDVETRVGEQLVDGRGTGSDPGPMRVDVVGDTPGVVCRPNERWVGHAYRRVAWSLLRSTPVAQI